MECLHCNKQFTPHQKYCSDNCRIYAFNKRKNNDNVNITNKHRVKTIDNDNDNDNDNVIKPPDTPELNASVTEWQKVEVQSIDRNKKPTKKINKAGYCPHYVLGTSFCVKCGS